MSSVSGGYGNNWIAIRCVGTVSNRSAIGALVQARANIRGASVNQTREISAQTGGGNSGQSSFLAFFGLGDANNVDTLVVHWPSGITKTLTAVAANQILTVTEQQTALEEESLKPHALSLKLEPTIVRSALSLGVVSRQSSADRAELLDITGRTVLDLRPGANDVSRLASGLYFVVPEPSAASRKPSAVSVRKVVVQR